MNELIEYLMIVMDLYDSRELGTECKYKPEEIMEAIYYIQQNIGLVRELI